MITAIVMASGLSTRMGENKLLLNYKGIPIIEHTFRAIKDIKFKEVIVVSQYEEILNLAKEYKYKTIKNNHSSIGQSESIKLGILNSSISDGYMFFVGDQPLINRFDIERIVQVFEENKDYVVIPKSKTKSGNPVVFPYAKKHELLSLKNDEKGKKVIQSTTNIKYVEVCEEILFDIDTKKDYDIIRGE